MVGRWLGRMSVARMCDRSELYARAARLAGRFEDLKEATDVADNHDQSLDESYQ